MGIQLYTYLFKTQIFMLLLNFFQRNEQDVRTNRKKKTLLYNYNFLENKTINLGNNNDNRYNYGVDDLVIKTAFNLFIFLFKKISLKYCDRKE